MGHYDSSRNVACSSCGKDMDYCGCYARGPTKPKITKTVTITEAEYQEYQELKQQMIHLKGYLAC